MIYDVLVPGDAALYLQGEEPDHCMVIKHVLHVGDSKRVLDEYTEERMLGGTNTLELHNTFEDSLLANPSRRNLEPLPKHAGT